MPNEPEEELVPLYAPVPAALRERVKGRAALRGKKLGEYVREVSEACDVPVPFVYLAPDAVLNRSCAGAATCTNSREKFARGRMRAPGARHGFHPSKSSPSNSRPGFPEANKPSLAPIMAHRCTTVVAHCVTHSVRLER